MAIAANLNPIGVKMVRIFCILLITQLISAGTSWAGLNGLQLRSSADIRYLGIFKVYTAYLYTAPSLASDLLLDSSSSRCLKLDYSVDLTVDNFIEAADTILQRQHEPGTLAAVQPEISSLHANYQNVREGDSYLLCYDSARTTTSLFLNDNLLVEIDSPEFAKIYFGIWLDKEDGIATELLRKLSS